MGMENKTDDRVRDPHYRGKAVRSSTADRLEKRSPGLSSVNRTERVTNRVRNGAGSCVR